MYAGRPPGDCGFVDAIHAKSAFHRNRDARRIEANGLRWQWLAIGEMRGMNNRAGIVRTGHDAVGAADAKIVVDRHQTIGALGGRPGRTDVFAGGIGAMHAGHGQKGAAHIGKLAGFQIEHTSPLDSRRCRIGALARRSAGLATDAAAQIDAHHIAGHTATPSTLRTCTLTISDPEPVASVSSSDIGAIVFRLGMSRSLANGWAQ